MKLLRSILEYSSCCSCTEIVGLSSSLLVCTRLIVFYSPAESFSKGKFCQANLSRKCVRRSTINIKPKRATIVMSIDALEITYGRAMGTAKYHRVVGVDGQAADVNAAGSSSIYIWYHRGDEAPIYQLEIIQADEPVPEGFVKLGKTVTKGTDARAFLCYSSAPTDSEESVLPMCRLLVAGADEPKLQGTCMNKIPDAYLIAFQSKGMSVCSRPSAKARTHKLFCGFSEGNQRRQQVCNLNIYVSLDSNANSTPAVDEGPVFSLDDVQPGQWFDVYDSVDRWFVGKIVTKTDSEVTISYKNLSSIYNETFKRSETHRFAPLHTHTTKWTRQGEYWDVTDEELEAFTQKLQDYHSNVISDSRARSAFADVEVPEMTHRLLRSRYATVETQDAVFDCLKAVIQVRDTQVLIACVHCITDAILGAVCVHDSTAATCFGPRVLTTTRPSRCFNSMCCAIALVTSSSTTMAW